MSNKMKKIKIYDWLFITLGVAIAAFSYAFFIEPNNIVTGGVGGVGVILKNVFSGFDPSLTILIANILLLILGFFFVGRDFFVKTIYGSLIYPLFIKLFMILFNLIPEGKFEIDMTLTVLFAAIISGVGLGISVKHGGSTGGTEVLEKIFFKYFHMPYSTALYILDGSVILLGLVVVGNIQNSLYAIVFTFIVGVVIDAVVFSGFNKRAVYIISPYKEEIKEKIFTLINRSATSIKVVGEYSKDQKDMLLCVLSTNEYYKLREIIDSIDPRAFYFAVRASEVRGEGFTYEVEKRRHK